MKTIIFVDIDREYNTISNNIEYDNILTNTIWNYLINYLMIRLDRS